MADHLKLLCFSLSIGHDPLIYIERDGLILEENLFKTYFLSFTSLEELGSSLDSPDSDCENQKFLIGVRSSDSHAKPELSGSCGRGLEVLVSAQSHNHTIDIFGCQQY